MSIIIDAPGYDLRKTLTCGQVFRYKQLSNGAYFVQSRDKICTVQTSNGALSIDCEDKDNLYWTRYFNPLQEPSSLQQLMSSNAVLQAAYVFSKGIQLLRQDPFECLITFIISQQKRIPQIKATVDKLCSLCGPELAPGIYGFPEAKYITHHAISELRLGYRAPYLTGAVREVYAGELVLEDITADKVSYIEAIQRLQRLYGVGFKIANCVALFSLGFYNAFPIDTHIRQLLELPEMSNFREEDCGEYAGLVQQYLYNYAIYNGY